MRWYLGKFMLSIIFCRSQDTVAKQNKRQPSCSKVSRTIARISAGNKHQDILPGKVGGSVICGIWQRGRVTFTLAVEGVGAASLL